MDWVTLILTYVVVAVVFSVGFIAGAQWKAAHTGSESTEE